MSGDKGNATPTKHHLCLTWSTVFCLCSSHPLTYWRCFLSSRDLPFFWTYARVNKLKAAMRVLRRFSDSCAPILIDECGQNTPFTRIFPLSLFNSLFPLISLSLSLSLSFLFHSLPIHTHCLLTLFEWIMMYYTAPMLESEYSDKRLTLYCAKRVWNVLLSSNTPFMCSLHVTQAHIRSFSFSLYT